ncbi:hypothetical protein GR28A_00039 [Vibrio phage vB_VcorM_GR28A]|nr:hypothetical protein GR28A_00039 [Vibrio phage vB_VcorM_GR28A]
MGDIVVGLVIIVGLIIGIALIIAATTTLVGAVVLIISGVTWLKNVCAQYYMKKLEKNNE